ncbi:molybdenum ABC transporter ATP-binding protein [Thiohalorhabdus methylotrophus]|uniref:Molybdenum ABC transporter ATP-binding protein n=1 Tax=Thiohalorhabdus methylotrophus TaxID=3242694 RepID=A0ABV4TSC4_9GAMM
MKPHQTEPPITSGDPPPSSPFLQARFRLERPGFLLDATFDAPGGGFTALFGPSGSGKTTLLRCLAGLERAAGYLIVDGEAWQADKRFLAPHRRAVGYVFQEANLFPHRTVAGNLRYGRDRTRRTPPSRDEVVALLGLEALLDRRPHQLSGGQRQRVALGRALLAAPRLLLLDEPLSALDRASREEILPYLERLRDQLHLPAIYVSHNLEEVTRLSDRLVLLEEGRVLGAGPLEEMTTRLDLPLAHDREAEAVVGTRVAGHDRRYALTALEFPGGVVHIPLLDRPYGAPVRVRIPARDVSLTTEEPRASSILNVLPARVVELQPDGPEAMMVRLEAGGLPLLARVTRKSCDTLDLRPGLAVHAQIKSAALAG